MTMITMRCRSKATNSPRCKIQSAFLSVDFIITRGNLGRASWAEIFVCVFALGLYNFIENVFFLKKVRHFILAASFFFRIASVDDVSRWDDALEWVLCSRIACFLARLSGPLMRRRPIVNAPWSKTCAAGARVQRRADDWPAVKWHNY